MWKLDVVVASIVVGTLAVWTQAPDLPPGPVQAKVRTACLACHDSGIVVQQRLSRAAWAKELDKMIRWGATVAPEDREAFIEYFTSNFGPDKPPADLAQVAAGLVAQFFLAHAENVTLITSDVDGYPLPPTKEVTCSGCKDVLASVASISVRFRRYTGPSSTAAGGGFLLAGSCHRPTCRCTLAATHISCAICRNS